MKPIKHLLEMEAAAVEAHAKDCLQAWIILGETHKYEEEMERARLLRRAAEIKGIRQRAEFLAKHC